MIAGMAQESGARRPVWRVIAVLVVLLLIAAAGVGGWAIGRQGHTPAPPAVKYNVSPYWPLASHVYTGNGSAGAGTVTRWVPNGMPYGWPHTEDGARAAATAALSVCMTPIIFGDPSQASRMYGSTIPQFENEAKRAWLEISPQAPQVIDNIINTHAYPQMQGWPLAWKVDSTSTAANAGGGSSAAGTVNAVTIEIWSMATFVVPGQLPFSQRWFTEKLTVAWGPSAPDSVGKYAVSQDWQIQSATTTDGPVPLDVDINRQASSTPPGQLGWTSYAAY